MSEIHSQMGESKNVEPETPAPCDPAMSSSTQDASDSVALTNAVIASEGLRSFGNWAKIALTVLGLVSGAAKMLDIVEIGAGDYPAWTGAIFHFVSQVLGFMIAGSAVAAACQFAAALLPNVLAERVSTARRDTRHRQELLELMERIARAAEDRRAIDASPDRDNLLERARHRSEIERAIDASDWSEAERRMADFEVDFGDDPDLPRMKNELSAARSGSISERLAQLDAARRVNDTAGAFEIYEALSPILDARQKAELDQDLARWFLGAIQRRMRASKIQPDVVQLASRFAESFATTTEGASVRAALPTLRRSVGLCPRCAQPYTGIADACPQCLKSAPQLFTAADGDDMGIAAE